MTCFCVCEINKCLTRIKYNNYLPVKKPYFYINVTFETGGSEIK